MDFGINGKKAIVCAASKGLGRACARSLAREGVDVVISARTEGPLMETAARFDNAGLVQISTLVIEQGITKGTRHELVHLLIFGEGRDVSLKDAQVNAT